MSSEYLHSLFALAHTDIRDTPLNNRSRTLRVVLESNVNAHALTVHFSNLYGEAPLRIACANIAHCTPEGELLPGTIVPLTVNGIMDFTLPEYHEAQSDKAPFTLQPGDFFALNIYYPEAVEVCSGNWLDNYSLRSKPGNFSADVLLPAPGIMRRLARTVVMADMTVAITSVSRIVAHRSAPGRVVACFGDSITEQSTWTAPLAKLLHHAYPGDISLCNLGISGNRLLHDSPPTHLLPHPGNGVLALGRAGIHRFAQDVLALQGLTHTIIALGTNDIGQPGTPDIPEEELITLPQYAAAMEHLAAQLHEKGVKCYVATLTPRQIISPYTELREHLRHAINHWIRGAACFDAVLDFDKVLQRPDGSPGMRAGCHLPDGLHPNPYGGLQLAKSIDLALFGGEQLA